jgi:hypothetical protein
MVKLHYVNLVTLQGPLMLDFSYFPKDPVLQYTQGHPRVKLISESILFGVASTSWWSNQQICTVKSLYATWTHHGAKNHLLCITNYRFKSKHSNHFMTICCHSMDLAYILPDWR